MRRYTLPELRDAALRECPEAFQLVSDISTFTFERRAVPAYHYRRENVVLHLGSFQNEEYHYEGRIYAFINAVNSEVSILNVLPEKRFLLPLFSPPISDISNKRNIITRFVTPFDYAAEHPLPRSHEDSHDGYIARKEKNPRIVLLAQWAFLLAGRIEYIEHTGVKEGEILGEFVALCVHIYRQSKLAAEKLQAEASQVPNKDDKPAPGNVTDAQLEGPQQRDSHVNTLSKQASKRRTSAAFDGDSDDGSYTPTTTQGTITPTISQLHH